MKRLARISTILVTFLVGCGQSSESANHKTNHPVDSNDQAQMQQFKIGDTDFGIDATASSITVDNTDPERPIITIEISGDPSTFDPVTADDDSEWSWALYPPGFYLRGFPAQTDLATGTTTAHVTMEDIDNYEFSIYMMEHNNIDDVSVKLVSDKYLEISGRVDLFGDVHDFAIKWQR